MIFVLQGGICHMVIRRCGPEDLEGLLELYGYLFEDEDYSDIESYRDNWLKILDQSGLVYFGAFDEEIITASCNISIIPNLSRKQRSYA